MNDKELIKLVKEFIKKPGSQEIFSNILNESSGIESVLTKEKIGFLLRKLDLEQVPDFHKLKVGLVSNFTADDLISYLRFASFKDSIFLDNYVSPYNQYVYELMNKDSELYKSEPNVTVCLLDEGFIFNEISLSSTIEQIEATVMLKLNELENLIKNFTKLNGGLFILNTIPLLSLSHHNVIDYKTKAKLSKLWRNLNSHLLSLMDNYEQLIVLDIDLFYQDFGVAVTDNKMRYYGSMSFSQELLHAIAEEIHKIHRSILGLQKKCLVLDLDNTLWGGIIGDAGVHGIDLGPDEKPGNIYYEFQKAIQTLGNQGVLLTINSKNEWSNAKEVFHTHPHTVLKEEDFVKVCSNWEPKHENIKETVNDLNIGMNSLVFIDDNPFEREMVKTYLPDVEVPNMPNDPSYYISELLNKGWFNTISLTKEDYSRKEKYQQIVQRETLKKTSHSIEEYLEALDIKVEIIEPNNFTIPRLAQLTQRTNQFNMTTERLQEKEVKSMSDNLEHHVFGFKSSDKFGDNGIVGVVFINEIIKNENRIWNISNFIMSCRVFSRGIETVVLSHVLKQAKNEGVNVVIGNYIPSKKNHIVKDFYINHGFNILSEENGAVVFDYNLSEMQLKEVPWIQLYTNGEVVQ
ncbi:HAD-IIIC family phosphatase [Bacillus sp. BH2]|uniref:HAD-IIIC family phosphatase n=1 Tax=Bacillus sp. BH2 TaxID=2528958 RepID=UPI001065506D|nr:HAD-IIIC family phosphatase [Bacillus sp. BH2]TEA45997.1 HAD-IIIC family phosphatase [Bacillus sp. BH2]